MTTTAIPLDDFLAGDDAAGAGEWVEQLGWFMATTGLLVALGLLVFLRYGHRGQSVEVGALLRVAVGAGAVVIVGAVLEVIGIAQEFEESWTDAFRGEFGAAAMMRLLAGLLLALGLVGPDDTGIDDGSEPVVVQWSPTTGAAFGVAGAVVGVVSYAFDGHTVSQGPRAVHAAVSMVHVGAAGVWLGGVCSLVLVHRMRRRTGTGIGAELRTFSSIATVALVAVALAGSAMTGMIVEGPSDLVDTDWGRTLLVKTGVVAVAAALGAYHHFVAVPAAESTPSRSSRLALAVETGVLVVVVVATSFLVTAAI